MRCTALAEKKTIQFFNECESWIHIFEAQRLWSSTTTNYKLFKQHLITKVFAYLNLIVRRSPPRHSPPQTFTTSDIHHPLCKIRRSPPQTFTTSDVHHLRRSPPQTFTTSDIHHPQCKIRRSPPQTFTTPDVHHLRRSPPQTFTTPFVKSDVHHPRHSPPQTFTTPYSKMRHSPPTNIHQPLQSSPPKEKFTNRPSIQNVPAVQTTLHQGSRGQSKQWLMIFETVKHGKQWKCLCTPL